MEDFIYVISEKLRKVWLITIKSFEGEKKSLILIGIILIYYILLKSLDLGLKYQSIITALFWVLLSGYVYLQGNVRFHSKLKHKEFYLIFMLVCGVLYIISYFAFGFIDGFGINIYDTSFGGAAKNILTLGSVLVLKEFIRNNLMNSVQRKYALSFGVLVTLVYTFAEVNFSYFFELGTMEEWLSYLSLTVLPVLVFNAFMTYAVYIMGALGPIIYSSLSKLPLWVVSVVPSFRWVTSLLVGVLLPILFIIVLKKVSSEKSIRGKKRQKKKENPYSWLATAVIIVVFAWFALGIFPVFPSVIVSQSMQPYINRGDMVFIQKSDSDDLVEGDIIQYQLENIQVVHRIIKIEYKDGVKQYITKGDANNAEDAYPVSTEQIMGKYIGCVPYIGWPVVIMQQKPDDTLVETGEDNIDEKEDY